jgi:cell fate (sporulation/competence/biofilm development) regulator YlbF (YheA/YmcA/DUF963 family)
VIIHDKARELSRLIRSSDEYRALEAAKSLLKTDSQAKTMVKDFLQKQLEFQLDAMNNKQENAGKKDALQKMLVLLYSNPNAKTYVESHFRFQQIMVDVQKILGEDLVGGMNPFGDDIN